ncbi:copper resistance protein NlpE [Sphingobacterium sp. E70]|uniref:copper resistance protein NlpE n=1 Tax=Sphingobacterium sp. E70 TaxID=2853439 RepID=UPI00211C2C89|nr:copper resistance protein NlpE [Sphingobacterium sp. E70]ULT29055.1 copper resistance protein NlpE [Sphingobacterium sp. E70]
MNETYSLEETYLGKSDQAIQSKGPMLIERGYEKDNDATLYILNPDSDTEKRYFVRLTAQPGKLIMLDKDQKIINSKLNYTLSEEK